MPFYDDPAVFYDAEIYYDDDEAAAGGHPPLDLPLPSLGTAHMEYWEITKDRAIRTLPVWQTYLPTLKINEVGPTEFEALIDQYEPLAQLRTTAQDEYDTAARAVRFSLLKMKILGIKVPQIIEAQLTGAPSLVEGLERIYRISPRSESTIIGRARALNPVWLKANALLAAMTPPGAPITRAIQGVPQTAAMLDALADGLTALQKTVQTKEEALLARRSELRALDRKVDQLNKAFYQVAKNTFDPGTAAYEALAGIPTETGSPAPETIQIDELTQGGTDGLQVLVSYEPDGGDHATTKEVQWQVEGVDADFTNTVPLDASGNALGPFTVGQVVKVRTRVSNSVSTRTSAVRSITIEEPI